MSDGSPVVKEMAERVKVYHRSKRNGGTDEWGTPWTLFRVLARKFDLRWDQSIDVCASPDNHKLPHYYSLENGEDGLALPWSLREKRRPYLTLLERRDPSRPRAFLNPPYSQIADWMDKAVREAEEGVKVVCLVPARVGTRWWWNYARRGTVYFLPGRLKFLRGDIPSEHAAGFPSAVVVFDVYELDLGPGTVYWDWKKEIKE